MHLLGQLGIDIKLLIAQIINFGLLLWLLSKFLYKPIIKRIEKDEQELRQARIQNIRFNEEREQFAKKQKAEIAKIKRRSQEIIKEAESIASQIRKQIKEEATNEKKAIIERAKQRLEAKEEKFKQQIKTALQKETVAKIKHQMKSISSGRWHQAWHTVFFDNLLNQIKQVEFSKDHLTKLLDNFASKKNKTAAKALSEKEILELEHNSIGGIILEYAYPLSEEEDKKLIELLAKKIGVKSFVIKILKKKNSRLLGGFRLETAGLVFESNLLNEINNAVEIK
jgi:F-type H+-transporting ATPase subunit b